ncbi:hypothetical protein EQH57_0334 [Dictyocoela roeselum]|nr:hypothetical protein EQH57_0334 [Dictyocoela roeselum]
MKETITDGQTLETEVVIKQKTYKFLLDTGSAYTYIDEKIAVENDLPIQTAEKNVAILVDGSKIESSKHTNLELRFQGDEATTYKIKAKVLKDMSLPGILGMDFLLRNYAKIDL